MMAHESFAGRPLGLVVNLHYEDSVSFVLYYFTLLVL